MATLLSVLSLSAVAESILQVLPTRLVLEKQRSGTLTISNRGDEEGSYRLMIRNYRMGENGGFNEIEEAGEGDLFADKLIRFSPRRVTVPPRSKQDVRVVIRKPKGLPDGEYRSHLVFRKLPKQTSVLIEGSDELQVSMVAIIEVSIPIIVRHGKLSATATMTDLGTAITKEKQEFNVTLHREGNQSLYGELEILWKKPGKDKEIRVGYTNGVAVYVPNKSRGFTLPTLYKGNIKGGTLRAVFKDKPEYGGDSLARTEITL